MKERLKYGRRNGDVDNVLTNIFFWSFCVLM